MEVLSGHEPLRPCLSFSPRWRMWYSGEGFPVAASCERLVALFSRIFSLEGSLLGREGSVYMYEK